MVEFLFFFSPLLVPILLIVGGVAYGVANGLSAVLILWWTFLVIAGAATVLIGVPILVRFVHHAREIDRLARLTLEAARGVANDTANIPALEKLLAHAGGIATSAAAIDGVAARIHADGAAAARLLSGRGG